MFSLIRHRSFMLIATAVLVVCADLALAGTAPGWTVGLCLLMLLGLVVWRHPTLWRESRARTLIIVVMLIAGTCGIGDSWLAPSLAGMGLLSLVLIARGGLESDALLWLRQLALAVIGLPLLIRSDRRLIQLWQFRHGSVPTWSRLMGRWLLPLGIGGGFLSLFGFANPIIAAWWSALGDWLLTWDVTLPTCTRMTLWAGIAASCWVILRGRRCGSVTRVIYQQLVTEVWYRDSALVIRSLVVVNLVFAAQTVMDACYLLGGLHLPTGMTYAAYAHRGAYPLLVATLVSAAMVLTVFHPNCQVQSQRGARRLVVLWLGQNVALVIAALWRLHLYVDMYSLTTWRLAAAVWMLLVAIGLVLLVIRILSGHSHRWLINANALTTIIVLMLWCAIDSDRMIAWHNVRHCAEVGAQAQPLDFEYLSDLGPTTAPALRWLAENSHNPTAVQRSQVMAQQREQELRILLTDSRAWTWWRWSAMSPSKTQPFATR